MSAAARQAAATIDGQRTDHVSDVLTKQGCNSQLPNRTEQKGYTEKDKPHTRCYSIDLGTHRL